MSEAKKNEKQEKTAAQTSRGTAKKNSAPEKVAYIGPAIRGVVQPGTVFNNGLLVALQNKVKELPVLGSLLVPVQELGKARKELRDGATALSACYKKAELMLNKKEEESC